jgi:hypothetical protein
MASTACDWGSLLWPISASALVKTNPLAEMLEGGVYVITTGALMVTEDKSPRPLKGELK